MQALIVVEPRHPFARVGLVEIAGNDHGIAASLGGSFPWNRRDEGNLPSVGRPGEVLPSSRQWGICTRKRRQEGCVGPDGMRDQDALLVASGTAECDPLAVARPARTAGGLVTAEANALLRAQIHHPQLVVRPTRAIAHRYRVCKVAIVRRERYAADRAQARKVAARQELSAGRRR